MAKIYTKFLKDERGATAIEYCMIAAAMCVCLLAAMPLLSAPLGTKIDSIGTAITSFK